MLYLLEELLSLGATCFRWTSNQFGHVLLLIQCHKLQVDAALRKLEDAALTEF